MIGILDSIAYSIISLVCLSVLAYYVNQPPGEIPESATRHHVYEGGYRKPRLSWSQYIINTIIDGVFGIIKFVLQQLRLNTFNRNHFAILFISLKLVTCGGVDMNQSVKDLVVLVGDHLTTTTVIKYNFEMCPKVVNVPYGVCLGECARYTVFVDQSVSVNSEDMCLCNLVSTSYLESYIIKEKESRKDSIGGYGVRNLYENYIKNIITLKEGRVIVNLPNVPHPPFDKLPNTVIMNINKNVVKPLTNIVEDLNVVNNAQDAGIMVKRQLRNWYDTIIEYGGERVYSIRNVVTAKNHTDKYEKVKYNLRSLWKRFIKKTEVGNQLVVERLPIFIDTTHRFIRKCGMSATHNYQTVTQKLMDYVNKRSIYIEQFTSIYMQLKNRMGIRRHTNYWISIINSTIINERTYLGHVNRRVVINHLNSWYNNCKTGVKSVNYQTAVTMARLRDFAHYISYIKPVDFPSIKRFTGIANRQLQKLSRLVYYDPYSSVKTVLCSIRSLLDRLPRCEGQKFITVEEVKKSSGGYRKLIWLPMIMALSFTVVLVRGAILALRHSLNVNSRNKYVSITKDILTLIVPNGYCYLILFPVSLWIPAAITLGKCPLVRDVKVILDNWKVNSYLYGVITINGDVVHISIGSDRIILNRLNDDLRVGGVYNVQRGRINLIPYSSHGWCTVVTVGPVLCITWYYTFFIIRTGLLRVLVDGLGVPLSPWIQFRVSSYWDVNQYFILNMLYFVLHPVMIVSFFLQAGFGVFGWLIIFSLYLFMIGLSVYLVYDLIVLSTGIIKLIQDRNFISRDITTNIDGFSTLVTNNYNVIKDGEINVMTYSDRDRLRNTRNNVEDNESTTGESNRHKFDSPSDLYLLSDEVVYPYIRPNPIPPVVVKYKLPKRSLIDPGLAEPVFIESYTEIPEIQTVVNRLEVGGYKFNGDNAPKDEKEKGEEESKRDQNIYLGTNIMAVSRRFTYTETNEVVKNLLEYSKFIPQVLNRFVKLTLPDYINGVVRTKPYAARPVVISDNIKDKALQWLISNSQNYPIINTGKNNSNHPLNAAMRSLAREVIKRHIQPGLIVGVIGSNPAAWPIDGFVHIIPVIDAKDACRNQERRAYIERLNHDGVRVQYTTDKLQDVKGRFDVLISVHSTYDICMEDLFFSALRLCAKDVFVVIVSSLSLYEEIEGILPGQNMNFKKYMCPNSNIKEPRFNFNCKVNNELKIGDFSNPSRLGSERISFSHLNEATEVYTHNWYNVRQYMVVRTVVVTDKLAYRGDTLLDLPDCVVMRYSLSKISDDQSPQYLNLRNHHGNDLTVLSLINEGDLVRTARTVEVDRVMMPIPSMTQMMATIRVSLDNPRTTVESMAATVVHLANGWHNSNYHPFSASFEKNVSLVYAVIKTLRLRAKLEKEITDIENKYSGLKITNLSIFTLIINSLSGYFFKYVYNKDLINQMMIDISTHKLVVTEILSLVRASEVLINKLGRRGTGRVTRPIERNVDIIMRDIMECDITRIVSDRYHEFVALLWAFYKLVRVYLGGRTWVDTLTTAELTQLYKLGDVLDKILPEIKTLPENTPDELKYIFNEVVEHYALYSVEPEIINRKIEMTSSEAMSNLFVSRFGLSDEVIHQHRTVRDRDGDMVHVDSEDSSEELLQTYRGTTTHRGGRYPRRSDGEFRPLKIRLFDKKPHLNLLVKPKLEVSTDNSVGGNYLSFTELKYDTVSTPLAGVRIDHVRQVSGRRSCNIGRCDFRENTASELMALLTAPGDRDIALQPNYSGCLGEPSNYQNRAVNYDLDGYVTSGTRFGPVIQAVNGDLLECIFHNPKWVADSYNLTKGSASHDVFSLYHEVLESVNYIIFCNNIFITNINEDEFKYLDLVALVYRDGQFSRLVIPKDWSPKHLIITLNLIKLDSNDLYLLDLYGHLRIENVGEGLCFYKAIGDEALQLVLPTESYVCDIKNILVVMERCKVGVIHKTDLYIPPVSNITNVKHYVVVIGNHCYRVDQKSVQCRLFQFVWRKHTAFNIAVAGIIPTNVEITNLPRVQFLIKFQSKLRMYLDSMKIIVYPIASIIDAALYNIHLELNLISRFLVINGHCHLLYLKAITDFYIYDLSIQRFINKNPDDIYSHGWYNDQFVRLQWDNDHKVYRISEGYEGLVLMNSDTEFVRSRQVVDVVYKYWNNITTYNWDNVVIHLVEGVPGCGKTYEVIRKHRPGIDLVLTATRSALSDYKQISQLHRKFYRTYDSIILNGGPIVDTIYADEGLMVHAGDLFLVVHRVRASRVYIYGDRQQIPFINRALGYKTKYHLIDVSADNVSIMNVTYRLPSNMMTIMSAFYTTIETRSKIQGEIDIKVFKAIPQIPKLYDIMLTFTQLEKQVVSKYVDDTIVCTIHEVQGKTFNNVGIIRIFPQDNLIYSSKPHIIVGISRHRVSLHYYTIVENDTLSNVMLGRSYTLLDDLNEAKYEATPVHNCSTIYPMEVKHNVDIYPSDKWYTRIFQFLCQKLGFFTVDYNPYIPYTTYVVDYLDDDSSECPLSEGEMQAIIDNCYDRVDPIAQLQLRPYPDFPLEQEFSVLYFKLMLPQSQGREFCDPVLLTPQPHRFTNSLIELITAIKKRNFDPPMIHYTRSGDTYIKIVDRFFEVFVDRNNFEVIGKHGAYKNAAFTDKWLRSRNTDQLVNLDNSIYDYHPEWKYASHLKPDLKTPLDNTHNLELIAGQIVTAHHPGVNAEFAGVILEFTARLKSSLMDKWLINDGVTLEEMSGHVTKILYETSEFLPLEIDFSKFDKSQEELALMVQIELLRRFQIPEEILEQWFVCHTTMQLMFHKFGISVTTRFQRRSGDVMTFIGNTVIAMAALGFVYNLEDAYGGIFGGDDSIIFFPKNNMMYDHSALIAGYFNLYAKIENYPGSLYFASKFLVNVGDRWLFIPDPIKLLVKLGRHDMYCRDHINEYHISYSDNVRRFANINVKLLLVDAIWSRYHKKFRMGSSKNLIIFILNYLDYLGKDRTAFRSLYIGSPTIMDRPIPIDIRNALQRLRENYVNLEDELTE